MVYRRKVKESASHPLERVVHERLLHAARELDDDSLGRAGQIHQVRWRPRMYRALLRLVRH